MLFREISGVGPLTAQAFALVIDQPERFAKSRDVPTYLGPVPRKRQSGDCDPQLRITKAGNQYLRRLLVAPPNTSSAHSTPSRASFANGDSDSLAPSPRRGEATAWTTGHEKNTRQRASPYTARPMPVWSPG